MNTNNSLSQAAEALGDFLKNTNTRIATAESCTGGWLAQAITDIAGSSLWFDRGFITYTRCSSFNG